MSLVPMNELLRMQRANDWLEAVAGWQQSHGAERRYWRGRVAAEIARERAHLADTYQRLLDAAAAQQMKKAA